MSNPGPLRPADLLFPGRREAIAADRCASCFEPSGDFRNELSRKEFRISGFCQVCQDKTFGED